MAFFFFILAGLSIAIALMVMRKRRIESVFTAAADTLGLSCALDGLLTPKPWIYGFWNGYRVDVRPFRASKDPVNPLWTGYRVTFRKPVEMRFSGQDDPRRLALAKISEIFRESEVDGDSLFCARASLPHDSTILVKEINLLIQMAKLFEQGGPEVVESESEIVQEVVATPVKPPPLPRPAPSERKIETVPEQAQPEVINPEPSPPTPIERELTPVELAVIDLFGRGRNRYETGQHFSSVYKDETLEGRGLLRKVSRFSNDRFFGRGPGFLAEIEVVGREIENPEAVIASLMLELTLPDHDGRDRQLETWRAMVGAPVMVKGTAIHGDPFSRKLVLRRGALEPAETSD